LQGEGQEFESPHLHHRNFAPRAAAGDAMTSKFAAAVAAAFVMTTIAVRAADVPPDAEKTIAADYQLGCTAAMNPTDANLDAAAAFLSPDFVDIDVKGNKTSRDQVVALEKQQMKQLNTSVCDPSTESSVLNADGTITVVEDLHLTGTLQAPDGGHALEVTAKAQDTWKQVKGTWMQSQSQQLRNLVKMDGKVVQDDGQ
jgi:hypothetical protein